MLKSVEEKMDRNSAEGGGRQEVCVWAWGFCWASQYKQWAGKAETPFAVWSKYTFQIRAESRLKKFEPSEPLTLLKCQFNPSWSILSNSEITWLKWR